MTDYRQPDGRFSYKNIPPLEPIEGSGMEIVYGSPPKSKLRGLQHSSGTTSERPASPITGCRYFDEDLGYPVWWDGSVWKSDSLSTHTHSTHPVTDARADGDVTPLELEDKSVSFSFTDDIAGSSSTYDAVINVKGWNDTYRTWQLISSSSVSASDENLYYRSGYSTWGALQKVWTSGNDGTGSGLDADTTDGLHASQFLRSDTADVFSGGILTIQNTDGGSIPAGSASRLEIKQNTVGADACMAFHVGGDFAAYFGVDGDINDFAVGGWSMGSISYRIYHAGNTKYAGAASGTINKVSSAAFVTASTTPVLYNRFGFASVTRLGVGQFRMTLESNIMNGSTGYNVSVTLAESGAYIVNATDKTATTFIVKIRNTAGTLVDNFDFYVSVIGNSITPGW